MTSRDEPAPPPPPAVEPAVRFANAEDLTDCAILLGRLTAAEPAALVRLQASGAAVSCWTQPWGVVTRRDVGGRLDVADRTVAARDLALRLGTDLVVPLPERLDAAWRATLPPRAGWTGLDDVLVEALHGLAQRPPDASALDQPVLRVSAAGHEVAVALRTVLAMDRLGFLPDRGDEVARVACTAAWTRIASRLGTAYQRRSALGLG